MMLYGNGNDDNDNGNEKMTMMAIINGERER